MNAISIFLKILHITDDWRKEKSCKFISVGTLKSERRTHKTAMEVPFQSKLSSAGSCHYVTEMDLFCMRIVWTPESHAMHHIRRGWRVRNARKSQKTLFSINVADKIDKKKITFCSFRHF